MKKITGIAVNALFLLLCFCETGQPRREQVRELSPMEKITELSKSALVISLYTIVENDRKTLQPTFLPETRCFLYNWDEQKSYASQIADKNINVFIDIPPGNYRILKLQYSDPLSYPLISWFFESLQENSILVPMPAGNTMTDDPLYINVASRSLMYGGDFSLFFSRSGIKTAPPDFDHKARDMKKAAELIIAKYPHSRWAKEAYKILDMEDNF